MIGFKGAFALAAAFAITTPVGAQMTNSPANKSMRSSSTEMHKSMPKDRMKNHRMSHSTMMMSMRSCHQMSHARMMRNKQCRTMMRHHNRMKHHKM